MGPYIVLLRLEVKYKVRSKEGRILVLHHDHLKPYFMPTGKGNTVCQCQETGHLDVVHVLAAEPNDTPPQLDIGLRARLTHLRQYICLPVRYGDVP